MTMSNTSMSALSGLMQGVLVSELLMKEALTFLQVPSVQPA